MLTMREFPFPLERQFTIEAPEPLQVSAMEIVDEESGVLWAMVATDQPPVTHTFVMAENDEPLDRAVLGRFYATIRRKRDGRVWHVFGRTG